MLTRIVSMSLVLMIVNLGFVSGYAKGTNDRKAAKREAKIKKRAIKVKKAVLKLGASKDSKVKIKLRDKTKIKGYISKIGENNFTVVDKMGRSHTVDYRKTKQIKGNNLHAGVWIAIGVGVVILILLGSLSQQSS